MSDVPDLLHAPVSSVVKSPSPASGSIGNKSLLTMTGEAYSQLDPMRGRFVKEGDPRAKVIQANLEKQIADAKSSRNGLLPLEARKNNRLEPGQRVYHTARHEYGVISKKTADKKRIEVIFSGGKKLLVRIINLQKV